MSATPKTHASIAIDPVDLCLGEEATLTVTATLDHTNPITIFTWGTIFDTDLSLSQGHKCTDVSAGASIAVEERKKKRTYFTRASGSHDEVYFRTLEPGETSVFTGSFPLAQRFHNDQYDLTAGHRYRFEPRGQSVISRWWNGRKEEIMSPPGPRAHLEESSGPPIEVHGKVVVEFEVSERRTIV